MHSKHLLKVIIIFFSITIIIVSFMRFSSSITSTSSFDSIELNKLETEINKQDVIYIKGKNLKTASSNFLTSLTIKNSLNIQPYEYNYLSFSGYLTAGDEKNIDININVNGLQKTIIKLMKFIPSMYEGIFSKNINDFEFNNNNYYIATAKGLYSFDNNFNNQQHLVRKLSIKKISFFENKNKICLLTTDQKILIYNINNKTISNININLKLNNLISFKDYIYFYTENELFKFDISNNKQTLISKNIQITQISNFNNIVYISSLTGIFEINDDNKILSLYENINVLSFVFTKSGSLYYITNDQKLYLDKDIMINNILNINSLFLANNNILYLISSDEIFYFDFNTKSLIKTKKTKNNINIFQSFDDTFFIYSSQSIKGIIFYQEINKEF